MNSRRILAFLIISIGLLSSCSTDNVEISKPSNNSGEHVEMQDSLTVETKRNPNRLELFIETMSVSNYLLDTTRIKETIWSVMGKHPTNEHNGHVIIEIPFPIEQYQKHFTNPKSYFFAQWNKENETFKNGNDYFLLTWTIDSIGVTREKDIYHSLHNFMGNFPAYIFRSERTVYAMCHRLTAMATETRELTEELRNYIDSNALIHGPLGSYDPR